MPQVRFKFGPVLVAVLMMGGCSFSGSIGKSDGKMPSSRTSSKQSKPTARQNPASASRSGRATESATDAGAPSAEDKAVAAKATEDGDDHPGQGKERRCENAGKKEGHDKNKAKGEAKGHDICDD